jgi:6-phosphogluconate dehydrogenase
MSTRAMGMVGLGVMGRNLAYNIAENGFSVAAWDAWPEPVDRFVNEAAGLDVTGEKDLAKFVQSLRRPRRLVMLVKAGEVTDKTINALSALLEPGDILVDGGNEHFTATERRAKDLHEKGLRYFGMGVSGGEEGARHGPAMMPGGDREAYEELRPILEKIAARSSDGPCVTYCGPGGAGHYVKMVHNGIEYGDMQLIAEAYSLLKHLGGLSNTEIADTFDEWNNGELKSFLIEITARIFRVKDDLTAGDLVDQVLDATAMKGTGKWTVQDASDLGVPIPTIASSVEARMLAARKADRGVFATRLLGASSAKLTGEARRTLVADVRAALYAAKACSYAQGFDLLTRASEARNWSINMAEIARIWQAGCIIRAQFLTRIRAAYISNPQLAHLLLDADFVRELGDRDTAFRRVVGQGLAGGIPLTTLTASLGYYDTLRTADLPANLTQAQRDLFGAHGYKRRDRTGDFHSAWKP